MEAILADYARTYSVEGEGSVLGSMLVDPEAIPNVLPILPRNDMFHFPQNQLIYDALFYLYTNDLPTDAVALRDELKKRGELKQIGEGDEDKAVEYIGQLMESVPSSANCVYYAKMVREKWRFRQLYTAVQDANKALNEPGDFDQIATNIEELLLQLQPIKEEREFIHIKDIALQSVEDLKTGQGGRLMTNFRDLDRKLGGFKPGELIIIAGRPAMGKTALMTDMMINIAKAGTGVLIFTLEMPETLLTQRAICNLADVDMSKARLDEMGEWDWSDLAEQARELQGMNIILSSIGHTPGEVLGLTHRLRMTHGIGCVFIDYLQLMSVGRRAENRQQEVSRITRELKSIARRENVPVIVLSQLNRAPESRQDKRPHLSDLRDSGAIEQDADVVMMLYRDDYYDQQKETEPTGATEVIIAKQRNGPTGVVEMVFSSKYVKFGGSIRDNILI
jgi:replicative DNA helicase